MTVFFTLCSTNYLAHALTLGESLRAILPGSRLTIGLVDRVPADLPASTWDPHELIPVEELQIEGFADMARRYNIVELNTAVKPFYMEYLYRRDPNVEAVIYFDPDILVCGSLQPLIENLRAHPIVVTPHSCSFDDSKANVHYETAMLGTGIYNLGFIGTARSETTFAFLRWWQVRLRDHCYYRPGRGLFVDQLWMSLAPLYFDRILVEKNPGYNMCYWNHFERRLARRDGRYFVNDNHPLVFYHFSSFDPGNPTSITKRGGQVVMTFEERPDLREIYAYYHSRLIANGYEKLKYLPYQLNEFRVTEKPSFTFKGFMRNTVKSGLRALPRPVRRRVYRLAEIAAEAGAGS